MQGSVDANTLLSDVSWNGAPLTLVRWGTAPLLGDEVQARRTHRLAEFDSAVRANRQLAVTLRSQGLNEQADDYAYRAHVLRKSVLWRQALSPREDLLWKELAAIPPSLQGEGTVEMITEEVGRVGVWQRMGSLIAYVGSWLLDLLAGYGYRPGRAILLYLAVIIWFANFYVWATHSVISFGLPPSSFQPLPWYEALVLSVSSFHGRGFLPFPNLGDPVTIIAAVEAVFGLVIEVSFIATFTQRFLGK